MQAWIAERRAVIFLLGLLAAASGLVSTPVALGLGLVFGLTGEHPLRRESGRLAKFLLQASVVGLGFGMNLGQVVRTGRAGVGYTALSIVFAMGLGLMLGRWLAVEGRIALLITAGTAICGGSAIAALAPVAEASDGEISVAMGCVFLLNSVALLLFPALGWAMHLSQEQFGLWAALAIHDTSSVVGVAARYGMRALEVGTTVKLVRALWIVPVSLVTAAVVQGRRQGVAGRRVALPWFIVWFCLASVVGTFGPRFAPWMGGVARAMVGLGRTGLTVTLYLIGSSLSVGALRRVGARPLLLGVLLWVVVGGASAWAIHARWIGM